MNELQAIEKKKEKIKVNITVAIRSRAQLIEQEQDFTLIIKELNKSFIEAEAEENKLVTEERQEPVACPTCGHKKGEESEN